jgi:hypothetical protein
MVGREKRYADKCKEIKNDWNYYASCTLTSIPIWDLEHFKRLIFVARVTSIGKVSKMLL